LFSLLKIEEFFAMKVVRVFTLAAILACSSTACSLSKGDAFVSRQIPTLETSGTIIISGALPSRQSTYDGLRTAEKQKTPFASLLGYAPSASKLKPAHYTPAMNEYWLEISREQARIVVRRGEEQVGEFMTDGSFAVSAGSYIVESKEQNPSWYAPDEYFLARSREVPTPGSSERFRRGALGRAALFASSGLIIHSSPIWTPEVGGLRVEVSAIEELFSKLTPGTRIDIK